MNKVKPVLLFILTFILTSCLLHSAQNPCISNPLRITNVQWPASTTGQKNIGWTSSPTQSIASFDFTSPNLVVFTDTRGCTQTIRR